MHIHNQAASTSDYAHAHAIGNMHIAHAIGDACTCIASSPAPSPQAPKHPAKHSPCTCFLLSELTHAVMMSSYAQLNRKAMHGGCYYY